MRGRVILLGLAVAWGAAGCASGGGPVARAVAPDAPAEAAESDRSREDFAATVAELGLGEGEAPADWARVRDRMAGLADRYPRFAPAWYNLGVAEEALDRPEPAVEAYRRALALDEHPPEVEASLGRLLIERGRRAEADALLREVVARDPSAARARVTLGWLRLEDGDLDEVRRLGVEALTYRPRLRDAYCLLGEEAFAREADLRVELLAGQGFELDEGLACLHELLGRVARRRGDPSAALAHFERAVEAEPGRVASLFSLGEIALSFRDFERARAAFSAVTEAQPDHAAAWVDLGVARKGLGDHAGAEAAYLAAIESEAPAAAHYNLGLLYLRHTDRLDDAEAALKTYLRGADRPEEEVYAWLEEITARREAAEAARLAEEEARRQAELEALRAEEEARKQAELEARIEAERARARAAGEPVDPELPVADPVSEEAPEPEPEPRRPKRRRPRRPGPEPTEQPSPDEPASDFE